MNKSLDERLLPPGEYRDALNIEVSSVEGTNVGAVKNVQGNSQLTTLEYDGQPLLQDTVCIGAVSNDSKGVIYWFVHAPTSGVDMIVSYNEKVDALTYHVVSVSVLNFNPQYLITGVNIIDDLIIWTDNYNQPRKINVNREYPRPFLGSDVITEADIALIQAPPVEAPIVQPISAANYADYLDTRFVSFAYRYKYTDGEYSAMSQFSPVSFTPGGFFFDEDVFANGGMKSVFNAARIFFNTGSPNVVGIDLCFKLNDSNVVNVVEKFDKEEQGWSDFTQESIEFSADRIYTTLPESELLRVYDNVPRKARAQTIMGNRIMFGNYVDGFDIVDSNNQPILIDYSAAQVSESANTDGVADLVSSSMLVSYYQPPSGGATANARINLDFTNVSIEAGDVFTMRFTLERTGYNFIGTSSVLDPEDPFEIVLSVQADADYATAYDFWNSARFQNEIGTALNIQPISNACAGLTWSDKYACSIPIPVDNIPSVVDGPWVKYNYGVTAPDEPIYSISTIGSDVIDFQLPLIQFVRQNDPAKYAFVWYGVDTPNIQVSYIKNSSRSLHSNRGYETSIIYMDEFGRNTTSFVCQTNYVFIGPQFSDTRNKLRTTINSVAPSWASRYKFAIRQSRGAYETVYSNEYYYTAAIGYWFRLQGENQLKVRVGDVIIVKKDSDGRVPTLVEVEVLDIQSQPTNFDGASAPAGLYMKLPVNNFSVPVAVGVMTEPIVFETTPALVNESIYYESAESFQIINGFHSGNVQNQTALQPAIVDNDFFNCFCFGNGVEGYKVLDGITARSLVIGNRFSAVANEDYEETRRFSSITYSGVYGEQTNVNKLNEFNLALANYKDLEKIFGSIQILFGRQTDVLALQEDKISYVLAGKNLLSDAAAGGSITSVPEVLGTQMARLEDYGIGLNPESFASFGYEKYFTDAKRGAVLRLMGSSYSNDQLEVISEYGMGSWFRDRFIETTDKQKLGVYDPFMDQYILAIKDDAVESPEIVLACGSFIDSAVATEPMVFYIDAGTQTGNIQLAYTIGLIAGSINFRATFNGVQVASGPVTSSGSLNVNKTTAYPNRVMVEVIPVAGGGNFELQINCP